METAKRRSEIWRRRRTALFVALPVVAAVRISLWILPFRRIHRFVGAIRPRERRGDGESAAVVSRLARAVISASRVVPNATCLTQAISLHYLLARSGREGRIHIGVRRDTAGVFKAHAWVELDGVVVIGGGDIDGYVPLLELQEAGE